MNFKILQFTIIDFHMNMEISDILFQKLYGIKNLKKNIIMVKP